MGAAHRDGAGDDGPEEVTARRAAIGLVAACLACGPVAPIEPPPAPIAAPTEPPPEPQPAPPVRSTSPTAETFAPRAPPVASDVIVVVPVAPPAPTEAVVVAGPPPTDAIIEVACPGAGAAVVSSVDRFAGQLRTCYLDRAKVRPDLRGDVSISFVLGDGRANDVQITDNTTGDAGLAACVGDRVPRWGMPPAAAGATTCVLTFSPKP